jgi:hypothetical protein
MLADVVNRGTASKGAGGRASFASGRQAKRDDEMISWTPGLSGSRRRLYRSLDRFDQPRTIANGFAGDLAVPRSGALHEDGHRDRQAGVVYAATGHHHGDGMRRILA